MTNFVCKVCREKVSTTNIINKILYDINTEFNICIRDNTKGGKFNFMVTKKNNRNRLYFLFEALIYNLFKKNDISPSNNNKYKLCLIKSLIYSYILNLY